MQINHGAGDSPQAIKQQRLAAEHEQRVAKYRWECPKCGEKLEAVGPASLKFIKHIHEYWETRKESLTERRKYGI